jgi:hypothetical protein
MFSIPNRFRKPQSNLGPSQKLNLNPSQKLNLNPSQKLNLNPSQKLNLGLSRIRGWGWRSSRKSSH